MADCIEKDKEEKAAWNDEKTRLHEAHRTKMSLRHFIRSCRIPQGELRSSSRTRNMRGPSMPCDHMLIFKRCGKPEAINDRKSAGTEGTPQMHISENGHMSEFHYGTVHKPIAIKNAMHKSRGRGLHRQIMGPAEKPTSWDLWRVKCHLCWMFAISNTPSLRNISKRTKG